ncbi:MAG: NUDIX hydrolase [Chloroflexota bacterium]
MADRPTPPVRIVVGVGAIVTRGERVLLARRGHAPAEGAWSIPGGRVELGETLPEALRREIQEECCLDVTVGDVAIVLDRITRRPDGALVSHYLIVDFWATAASGQARASSDAAAVGWFTLDEIRQLPTTTNLASYLEEALRRRADGTPGCLIVNDESIL